MRTVAIAVVMLGVTSFAKPAALQPCPAAPDAYRNLLKSELTGRAPGRHIATFLAIPSFAPEYGLVISEENKVPRVTFVRFIESVWYGSVEEEKPGLVTHIFSKAKVKAEEQQFAISPELSTLLSALLTSEIAQAAPASSYGLDGETYVFTVADGSCAETWSPDKGTRNELLVRSLEEVGELVNIPTQVLRGVMENRLLNRLRARWAVSPVTPNTSLERTRER